MMKNEDVHNNREGLDIFHALNEVEAWMEELLIDDFSKQGEEEWKTSCKVFDDVLDKIHGKEEYSLLAKMCRFLSGVIRYNTMTELPPEKRLFVASIIMGFTRRAFNLTKNEASWVRRSFLKHDLSPIPPLTENWDKNEQTGED